MKYLVRDGSKKLKEAKGLPDEALLNFNRPRSSGSSSRRRGDTNISSQHKHSSKSQHRGNSGAPPVTSITPTRDRKEARGLPGEALLNLNRPRSSGSSSRRRGDTNSSSQHHQHSSKSHHRGNSGAPPTIPTIPSRDRNINQQHDPAGVEHVQNCTTPPKLNRHPRDRPSKREGGPKRFTNVSDPCSDLFAGGDSDWSDALAFPKGLTSIWNCGATRDNNGTMSPHKQYENGGEGRDSGDKSMRNDDGLGREGNSVRKINSPERNEVLVA